MRAPSHASVSIPTLDYIKCNACGASPEYFRCCNAGTKCTTLSKSMKPNGVNAAMLYFGASFLGGCHDF